MTRCQYVTAALLCAPLLIAAAALVTASRSKEPPKGVYLVPASKSFGTVKDHDSVQAEFHIHNQTASPVKIVTISTSCGCTMLKVAPRVIPPGGEALARLVVDLTGRHGKQRFQAFLTTDRRESPTMELELHGTVIRTELGQIPYRLGSFAPGQTIDETIKLSKGGRSAARLIAARLPDASGWQASIVPEGQSGWDGFRVHILGRAPSRLGSFQQEVILTAKDADWQNAKLVLLGFVESEWIVPTDLFLGIVTPAHPVTKTFAIRRRFPADAGAAVTIEAKSIDDHLTVKVLPETSGEFPVEVTGHAFGKEGGHTSHILLKVNVPHGQTQSFDIPVHAFMQMSPSE